MFSAIQILVQTGGFYQWILIIQVNHSASLSSGLGRMSSGIRISTLASSSSIGSVGGMYGDNKFLVSESSSS